MEERDVRLVGAFSVISEEILGKHLFERVLTQNNEPEWLIKPEEGEVDLHIELSEGEKAIWSMQPSIEFAKANLDPQRWAVPLMKLKELVWTIIRVRHDLLRGDLGIRKGWKIVQTRSEEPQESLPGLLLDLLTQLGPPPRRR